MNSNTKTKKTETDWASYGLAALEGAAAVAAGYFLIKHGSDLQTTCTRTIVVEKPRPKSILEELLQGEQSTKKRTMVKVGDVVLDVNAIKSATANRSNRCITVTLHSGEQIEAKSYWPEHDLDKLIEAMNES